MWFSGCCHRFSLTHSLRASSLGTKRDLMGLNKQASVHGVECFLGVAIGKWNRHAWRHSHIWPHAKYSDTGRHHHIHMGGCVLDEARPGVWLGDQNTFLQQRRGNGVEVMRSDRTHEHPFHTLWFRACFYLFFFFFFRLSSLHTVSLRASSSVCVCW